MRADQLLVERGHAASRSQAQRLIAAGVRWRLPGAAWQTVRKNGEELSAQAELQLQDAAEARYVSRGGLKLEGALQATGLNPAGWQCLDVGQSTGGFTDCLLRRGAERVIALDVGYGQLDWRLRQDPRVHVMERTNARHLSPGDLPWAPDLVTCDLSFISIGTVWGAVVPCCAPGWRAMVMVKPQFEVGKERVGAGGVVRDPQAREDAVQGVIEVIRRHGGQIDGVADSGLPGPKGNIETFILARDAAEAGR